MSETTLADRLRSLRTAAGLSRQQLADASGISRYAIRDIEQGNRVLIHAATAQALSRVLRVRMETLLGG